MGGEVSKVGRKFNAASCHTKNEFVSGSTPAEYEAGSHELDVLTDPAKVLNALPDLEADPGDPAAAAVAPTPPPLP